jgi:hypothetical protein
MIHDIIIGRSGGVAILTTIVWCPFSFEVPYSDRALTCPDRPDSAIRRTIMPNDSSTSLRQVAAILGGSGVGLGAFGAHALKGMKRYI